MRIICVKDYETMSQKAAQLVAAQMTLKPDSVLGLATGSTPEGMYAELVRFSNQKLIDFSRITSFNLDEYYGLSPEHPQSYHYYMNRHLFSKVPLRQEQTHIPNGLQKDAATCLAYDQAIQQAGGIDLQVLGIGTNGHIGFNEPDNKFEAQTHLVSLDTSTIEANARFFEHSDEVPRQAVSMGIKTIFQAKKILLLASGSNKADAIHHTICGPITPTVPASILQLHPDVIVIVDHLAARKLPHFNSEQKGDEFDVWTF